MWRIQGFVGRVLHRCHGNSTLRLHQNHHVEDEVINSSAVLSTRHSSDSSSQKEEDGDRKRKWQRTFQFGHAELPRYTALDAVGWGAAAVLFMQICRRIHSQFSAGTEPSPTPGALKTSSIQKCSYHILLEILSRHDVLPRGRTVSCLQGVAERQNKDQSPSQSSSSSSTNSNSNSNSLHSNSENDHLSVDSLISGHQRELLNRDSPLTKESLLSASQSIAKQDNAEKTDTRKTHTSLPDEERLTEAGQCLKHVGDTSVPVILNIIGLENAKNEKYEEAFPCFLAAAKQGYSKAQFNTGVCYEKGRGVNKDVEKALYYYRLAARGGHKQAQYRYAKLLLTSRGQQSLEELDTAIDLLQQAAAAGLTKAQLCLASVYSQDPVRNGYKSIQYLQMAAESGDSTALLFLGQCYESGLGVRQNLRTAAEFYERAARAGNKQAQSVLTPPTYSQAEEAVLRSIRSAPCFSVADLQQRRPRTADHPAALPLLPHSWSTGSLCTPPSLSSTPLHLNPPGTERGTCQWTVGVG